MEDYSKPRYMSQDAVALLKQFVAALGRNDREGSNEAAFALLAMEAELGKKWQQVAKVLQTNGELTSANKAMRLAVAQTGRSTRWPGAAGHPENQGARVFRAGTPIRAARQQG